MKMNTNTPLHLILLTAIGVMPSVAEPSSTHGDPYLPVGRLNVSKMLVRTGVKPLLSWEIEYPKTTMDIIDLELEGGVTIKESTLVQIRVVGMGSSNNGHGNNLDGVDVSNPGDGTGGANGEVDLSGSYDDEVNSASFKMQTGDGAWIELIGGDATKINPNEDLYSWIAKPGETIDFTAQIATEAGVGNTVQWSTENNSAVVGLTTGDQFPSIYQGAEIGSFLSSYVNEDQTIILGPREIICLFELGSNDPGSESYDMQDLVVVVTFGDVPKN